MRIFNAENTPHRWNQKVNFADNKNVLVGYDMGQSCCENFGWNLTSMAGELIANDETKGLDGINLRLASYNFDPDFFEVTEDKGGDVDAHAKFKLVGPDGDIIYLTLTNSHNGYYAHGFTMEINGKTTREGSL